MGQCPICRRSSENINQRLNLCAACVLSDTPAVREQVVAAHARCRERFGLPGQPPRATKGLRCTGCLNACRIADGQVGYCGIRHNQAGGLIGGDVNSAAVEWYHDPLPTNCVADWVCPASGPAGFPRWTDTQGPEEGFSNLAVFYEACSFDCLFCQNWHFKRHSVSGPRRTATELAAAATSRTRCICFFGGDPCCQVEHALEAARLARQAAGNRILRICWETNGAMSGASLKAIAESSLSSGGCVKVDLKAWDEPLHRALCGVSNRRTLRNFERLSRLVPQRPDPPLLIASTLLVPGYVEAEQVGKIARFIAGLDPDLPYALLAFQPAFEMDDLPVTSRRQAEECLAAAQSAGLRRVRVGNIHLLK